MQGHIIKEIKEYIVAWCNCCRSLVCRGIYRDLIQTYVTQFTYLYCWIYISGFLQTSQAHLWLKLSVTVQLPAHLILHT